MDFEFPEFRPSLMPGGAPHSALIGCCSSALCSKNLKGKDQDFESRRIKLHEEAIKIEQAHCKLLEQHDKKILDRLNAELAEISVFIPHYPELSVPNWRSSVEEITDRVDRAGETGQKRQREDGQNQKESELQLDKKQKMDLIKSSVKLDKLIEEEMFRVETLEKEGNNGGAVNILNGLIENLDEILNGSEETEPVKKLIKEKSEPVKKIFTEKSEPVKNSVKEKSEPVKKLFTQGSEPVKKRKLDSPNPQFIIKSDKNSEQNDSMKKWAVFTLGYWHCTLCKIKTLNKEVLEKHFYRKRHKLNLLNNKKLSTEKSGPVKDPIAQESGPVKDVITEKSETNKNSITEKSEPFKELITEKSELNNKLTTEKSELGKKLTTEKSEPIKKLLTEKSEHCKDYITQQSEPIKELITEKSEPVKNSITHESEPVMELVAVKSEPEPEMHLNKKQKIDLQNSQLLIINKSEKPNEDKTKRISIYKEPHKISNKNKKSISIHESMKNYALFTKGYWHCTLCKIKNPSKKVLESHFYGKRHKSNLLNPKPANPKPLNPKPIKDLAEQDTPNLLNGSPNPKPLNPKPIKDLAEQDTSNLLNGSPNPKPLNPKAVKDLTEQDTSNLLNGSPNPKPLNPKPAKNLDEFLTETEFLTRVGNVIQRLETGYLCTVCNLPFVPLGNVKLHLKGKKHRKNVEKLESGSGPKPVKEFVSEPFKKSGSEPVKKSRYEPIKIYGYVPAKHVESGPVKPSEHVPVKKFGSEPVKISGSGPVKPSEHVPIKKFGSEPVKISGSGPVKPSEHAPVKKFGSEPVKISGSGPVKYFESGPVKASKSGPVKQCDNMIRDPVERMDPKPVKTELVCVLCEFRGCGERDLADHFWRAHKDLAGYFLN